LHVDFITNKYERWDFYGWIVLHVANSRVCLTKSTHGMLKEDKELILPYQFDVLTQLEFIVAYTMFRVGNC